MWNDHSVTIARVRWLLIAAIVVSIVHYVDNVVRFDQYKSADPWVVTGWITAPVVALSWFVFTAFGVWGYRELVAGRTSRAAIGLAVYSGSGLAGLAHFADNPVSSFDAFQLTFIALDIVLGIAIFIVALRLALGARPT